MTGVPVSPLERIKRAGLRATAPRVATLAAVDQHPHIDADGAAQAVRAHLGTVSKQAVYDCLHALTAAGLLRRIRPAGHSACYESRIGDNHHHLACRDCGKLVDVDCAVGSAPCLTPLETAGFVIDEAEVVYWGRCPDCAAG